MILNWTEDFDEIDKLMIPFPFGKLYKQINDGRFEKILKYLQNIMSPKAFSNIMETALDKFFEELLKFLKKFEKFVECRNSESYQTEDQAQSMKPDFALPEHSPRVLILIIVEQVKVAKDNCKARVTTVASQVTKKVSASRKRRK